jgi:hypothetical protein
MQNNPEVPLSERIKALMAKQQQRGNPLPSCSNPQDGVTEGELIAIITDEAGRETIKKVEAHLGACPCCKDFLDEGKQKQQRGNRR